MTTPELPEKVKQFLLDEVAASSQQPEDISCAQAMETWDICRNTAQKRLDQMVEEGKLTKHEGRLISGARGHFYKVV